MTLRDYIQKRHSIDVLLAMLPSETESYVGWHAVKTRLSRQGIIVADGTYRSRCKELVELGLAEARPLDPLKNDYVLTEKGRDIANWLGSFLDMWNQMQKGSSGIEKWRKRAEA